MADEKVSIFKYLDYRTYLREVIKRGPRGFQSKMASAAECQATYLIRVMKESAHLTDDQAFRISRFLNHPANETDYFLNLLRFERATDRELKRYYRSQLESHARERNQDVLSRLEWLEEQNKAQVQIGMFSSWQPSTIHLVTACPQLRTARAIAKQLDLELEYVKRTLEFLEANGFVTRDGDEYTHSGQSLRIPRESPLFLTIQHSRRELALRYLDKQQENNLHFSSVFATTRDHLKEIQEEFSALIERAARKTADMDSEEVGMIVLDFFQVS
jgi:uncharacterized protein (TIGR02147 family)